MLQAAPTQVKINARSAKGRTALHITANRKRSGVTTGGATRSEIKSRNGDCSRGVRFAEFLLTHNADLNLQDKSGATALLLAARANNIGVARYLLEQGCDPSIFDNTGSTPLHAAGTLLCFVSFLFCAICSHTRSSSSQRVEVMWRQWCSCRDGMPQVASGAMQLTTRVGSRQMWRTARGHDER